MTRFKLKCVYCGRSYDPSSRIWRCKCGKPLDVILELKDLEVDFRLLKGREASMWRYRELLPIPPKARIVTLGEGYTPVIVREVDGVRVTLKLDYLNPTGSFKDRGASVLVTHLLGIGVKEIVEDSSGNAGAAMAAYSAVAGIKCKVFVPADAPEGKKLQIASYGAELVPVKGSRAQVGVAAMKEAEKAYYAGHTWNPFFLEGLKTVAYEYVEQRGGTPDLVLIPVGSGGLFLGVFKGFKEMLGLGLVDRMPRLMAVQAEGFTPVYDAMYGEYGRPVPELILADGIAVPKPPRLEQVVKAIRETKGDVIIVNNKEILMAFKELARMGLFVEPTSATVLAALRRGLNEGVIEKGEEVYMPLTGIGLKAIDKLLKATSKGYL